METQTKFDLNEAIIRWREGLETSPAIRPENLDELETHLRDSAGLLESKGLNPEEAFWLARRRLGTSDALEAEYGKVNGMHLWVQRVLWMVIGFTVIAFLQSVASSTATLLSLLGHQFTLRGHALGGYSAIMYLGAWLSLFLWVWRWGCRNHNFIQRVARVMKRHPVWAALGLCLLPLIGGLASTGTNVLIIKVTGMQSYGVVSQWRFFTFLAFPTLAWPVLLAWLLSLNNQARVKQPVER